jgi:hypothetical protein
MLMNAEHARLSLAHNQLARLTEAQDTRLDCVCGVAWITLDSDPRDIVLERGQSFTIDRATPVLVHAIQGPAAIEVRAARRSVGVVQ